jgi:hypothetical protein
MSDEETARLSRAAAYFTEEQAKLSDERTRWERVEAVGIDEYYVLKTDKNVPLAVIICDDDESAKIRDPEAPSTYLMRYMRWRHDRLIWSRWCKYGHLETAKEFGLSGVRGTLTFASIDLTLKLATMVCSRQSQTDQKESSDG